MRASDIHIRDPFICLEGDTYYLLGTTGSDCWNKGSNFTLYTSDDLIEFSPAGVLVGEGVLDGFRQLWAPELHRFGEKYYLIVSLWCDAWRRGSMILVSDSVRGPFLPLTGEYITPPGWMCLDATLFQEDGVPYLIFSNEWVDPVTGDGDGALYVARLADDLTKLVSRPRRIVSGKYCGFSVPINNGEHTGYVAEGPFAVRRKGRIELYWSTFTGNGYCIARSVADNVCGDYTFDTLVFDRDGGHSMVFRDKTGAEKIVFHQPNTSPDERLHIYDLA